MESEIKLKIEEISNRLTKLQIELRELKGKLELENEMKEWEMAGIEDNINFLKKYNL